MSQPFPPAQDTPPVQGPSLTTSSLKISYPQKTQREEVTWMDEYHLVLDSEPGYSRDLEILACQCIGHRIYKKIPKQHVYTCPSQVQLETKH